MSKRRTTIFSSAALVSALVLVACGSGGESGNGSSTERDPLVILYPADPDSLDPHVVLGPLSRNINMNVLETLASFDESGRVVPLLAESWEVLPDELTWRFKLREGIEFHNGEPMDAHAFKYSTERMLDPEVAGVNDIPQRIGLDEVVVVDDYTVDIVTKEPTDLVETVLYRWDVLAPEYYSSESLEHVSRNPVGTGPYKVREYVKDERIVLEAWEDYREGPAAVEEVTVRIVPELSTRMSEIQTGNADIVTNLDPDQVEVIDGDPDLRVETVDSLRRVEIRINTDRPPLDDARVRQALNHAVNFDAINESLLHGAGERMTLPILGPDWQHPDLRPYEYDVDKARSLLAEAGVTDGLNLELNLASGQWVKGLEISQAVASDLAEVGITVEVVPQENSVFTGMVHGREVNDLFYVALSSQNFGNKDMQTYDPESAWNATGWPESSSDRGVEWLDMLVELEAAFDPEEQQRLVLEMSELLYEEIPSIMLWNQINYYAASNRTDWSPDPLLELYLYNVNWTEG